MENDQRRQGRLLAFLNPDKEPGDARPAFSGSLTLPDDASERRIALWAHTTKKGHTLLAGRVSQSAQEQIAALLRPVSASETLIEEAQSDGKEFAVDPGEVLLFANIRKTPEHAQAPDYWGYFNPGNGEALMRVSVWAKTDSRGKAMLSGALDVHEPARDLQRQRERHRGRSR
jgi:hypothetical protein